MSLHVPVDIHTPSQLSTAVAQLQTYRNELRDLTIRAKVQKQKRAELPELSETLTGILHSNNIAADSDSQLESLQRDLNTALKTAPVVHITLAATAGRTLKRQLTVWFRTQIHPLCLLTFATRGDIGGGIILQAGSHLYDYSFKDRLLANKSRLTEVANV